MPLAELRHRCGMKRTKGSASKKERIEAEIVDDLDEEFELELGEDRVDAIL
jgi:hypothetical protein